MKSYEEMARQILDDRDRILKKRRERSIRIQKITGCAVCFCMVVTASVFFCKNSDFRKAMQSADVLTDTGTMPAVTTAAVHEKTTEETTAIAEMELEAPRTTAPATTAAQTKPPEKRETTTVTTTVTATETVKQTEAAPIVTAASSEKTEVQTETTTQTTAQTTETTDETTDDKISHIQIRDILVKGDECSIMVRTDADSECVDDIIKSEAVSKYLSKDTEYRYSFVFIRSSCSKDKKTEYEESD